MFGSIINLVIDWQIYPLLRQYFQVVWLFLGSELVKPLIFLFYPKYIALIMALDDLLRLFYRH